MKAILAQGNQEYPDFLENKQPTEVCWQLPADNAHDLTASCIQWPPDNYPQQAQSPPLSHTQLAVDELVLLWPLVGQLPGGWG